MDKLDKWLERNPDSSNYLGFVWDELTGRNQRDEQNEFNRQQSLEAYQRDVEMWKMQNEYNSPSAQMARFQAAGLNPNLIYGQGSSGNASSAPSYKPASGVGRPTGMETFQKIASVIGTLIGLKGQMASADAAAARAKNLLLQGRWINPLSQANLDLTKNRLYNLWDLSPFSYDLHHGYVGSDQDSPLYDYNSNPWKRSWRGLARAAQDEVLLKYQDQLKNEQVLRMQRINSLLRQQDQFFKFDKYIGYGTDLLNGLLQFGNFGLGMKKFNFMKSLYY